MSKSLIILLGVIGIAVCVCSDDRVTTVSNSYRDELAERRRTAVSLHELSRYADLPDDDVAVCAAIEYFSKKGSRLTEYSAPRFVGFLEGRLGTSLPETWLHRVTMHKNLNAMGDPAVKMRVAANLFPARYLMSPPNALSVEDDGVLDQWEVEGLTLWLPSDCSMQKSTLTQQGKQVSLKSVLSRLKSDKTYADIGELSCSLAWTDSAVVIALYTDDGTAFPLLCLRASDGSILWDSRVLAFREGKPRQAGVGYHDVTVKVHRDRVFVFGTEATDAYLEVFSTAFGVRRYRIACSELEER